MILGIAPLVRGGSRGKAFLAAVSHIIGGVVGGAAIATGLWVLLIPLRQLPVTLRFALLAILVGLAVLEQASPSWRILPNRHVQVPQDWATGMSPFRAYFMYGVVLGAHLFTYVPHAAVFVSVVGGGLVLDLGHATLAGAALGMGRTVAAAYALWAPPDSVRIAGNFGLFGRMTRVGGEVLLGAMALWVATSLALRL